MRWTRKIRLKILMACRNGNTHPFAKPAKGWATLGLSIINDD